jgi:hypothetical protein
MARILLIAIMLIFDCERQMTRPFVRCDEMVRECTDLTSPLVDLHVRSYGVPASTCAKKPLALSKKPWAV